MPRTSAEHREQPDTRITAKLIGRIKGLISSGAVSPGQLVIRRLSV